MLETIYSIPFYIFEVPNLKIRKPSWIAMPQPMTVFTIVLISYFLVTGGKIIGCYLYMVLNNINSMTLAQ